jgi:hypothetical protein
MFREREGGREEGEVELETRTVRSRRRRPARVGATTLPAAATGAKRVDDLFSLFLRCGRAAQAVPHYVHHVRCS